MVSGAIIVWGCFTYTEVCKDEPVAHEHVLCCTCFGLRSQHYNQPPLTKLHIIFWTSTRSYPTSMSQPVTLPVEMPRADGWPRPKGQGWCDLDSNETAFCVSWGSIIGVMMELWVGLGHVNSKNINLGSHVAYLHMTILHLNALYTRVPSALTSPM